MMINAKYELLEVIAESNCVVIAATVEVRGRVYHLKQDYSATEYTEFMNNLDLKYNSGYGIQNLSGKIWLTDGKWIERGEYDGSEWWELREYPEIPSHLK